MAQPLTLYLEEDLERGQIAWSASLHEPMKPWLGDLTRLRLAVGELSGGMTVPPWSLPRVRSRESVQRFGRILENSCPRGMREWLREIPPQAELNLRVKAVFPLIPWELIAVEGQPLWQRLRLARVPFQQTVDENPPIGEPGRVLILANLDGLCGWSKAEAKLLEAVFQRRMGVDLWSQPGLKLPKLLEALSSGRYSIIHWIGYTHFDPQQPSQSQLLLQEGGVSAGLLRGLRVNNLDVVSLRFVGTGHMVAEAELWAEVFRYMGAHTVLTNLWEPSCDFSRAILSSAFSYYLQGESLGAALQRARREALQWQNPDPYCTVHTYLLAGDSRLALKSSGSPRSTTMVSELRPSFRLIVEAGPDGGREIPIYAQALSLKGGLTLGGRGLKPGDIELDDPDLRGEMARIEGHDDGQLRLTNCTGDPQKLKVNGLAVPSSVLLAGGESIALGQSRLRLEALQQNLHRANPELVEQHTFLLECQSGLPRDKGLQIELNGAFAVVGRLPECTMRLEDRSVSRHQFSLVRRDGSFYLLQSHRGQRNRSGAGAGIAPRRRNPGRFADHAPLLQSRAGGAMIGLTPTQLRLTSFMTTFEFQQRSSRFYSPRGYKLRRLVRVSARQDSSGRIHRLELTMNAGLLKHPCLSRHSSLILEGFLAAAAGPKAVPILTAFRESRWTADIREAVEQGYLRLSRREDMVLCRVSQGAEKPCPNCKYVADASDNFCAKCGKRLEGKGFWSWLRT